MNNEGIRLINPLNQSAWEGIQEWAKKNDKERRTDTALSITIEWKIRIVTN